MDASIYDRDKRQIKGNAWMRTRLRKNLKDICGYDVTVEGNDIFLTVNNAVNSLRLAQLQKQKDYFRIRIYITSYSMNFDR